MITINEDLKNFVKENLKLIDENTPKSWSKIYTLFEDHDEINLPGDFGHLMLDAGINIPFVMQCVPRRFLQFQDNITEYKIPENCTSIGMSAFEDTSIRSIKIPEKVDYIGYLAFAGTRLKSITLPDNVRTLDNAVFHSCQELESVDLGKLFKINNDTFTDCIKLKEIIIPDTIDTLHANNFDGCTRLKEIVYLGTMESFRVTRYKYPSVNDIIVHCTNGDYYWSKNK